MLELIGVWLDGLVEDEKKKGRSYGWISSN
jgi:hypothetical protein